jgi:hypothetical protein
MRSGKFARPMPEGQKRGPNQHLAHLPSVRMVPGRLGAYAAVYDHPTRYVGGALSVAVLTTCQVAVSPFLAIDDTCLDKILRAVHDPSKGRKPVKPLLLGTFAIAWIAGNAHADDAEPASVVALIREWRALEATCRGSGDPGACDKLHNVAQALGQNGLCFNGYGSGRRWVKC